MTITSVGRGESFMLSICCILAATGSILLFSSCVCCSGVHLSARTHSGTGAGRDADGSGGDGLSTVAGAHDRASGSWIFRKGGIRMNVS